MPWCPSEPGERPTLGAYVCEWIEENLVIPDGPAAGQPYRLTPEQKLFVLRLYELDPSAEGPAVKNGLLRSARLIRRAVLSRPKGWGKALALDTPIPMPSGWSTMGEIAVGAEVFDDAGRRCRVIGKSPVWLDADCWRVTFSDGEEIVASGDHLWTVEDLCAEYRAVTVDTRTLAAQHRHRADQVCRYRLPMPGALDLPPSHLPVDPYVLGVWLGDGNSDDGRITGVDPEVFVEIREAGYRVGQRTAKRWQVFGLSPQLAALGVLGAKHVPAAYLRASASQRLGLLQGLMDTDGSIYDTGVCEFTTTSPALRAGVEELLSSLGVKFATYAGRARLAGRDCSAKWRIKFTVHRDNPVFRLPRKLDRMRPRRTSRRLFDTRRIVAVVPAARVPTCCIEVDSPTRLFLVGRKMVQTHNSPFGAAWLWAEALGDVVFDGWDSDGRPVGTSWTWLGFKPKTQVVAVSEDQTANAWDLLLDMGREGNVLANYPGVEILATFVNVPRGRIEFTTSAARSREGFRPVACLMDQTESWTPQVGGPRLAATIRRNLVKTGGCSIESPNAFIPGERSVAEASFEAWEAQQAGRLKLETGIMFDHREAPPDTDPSDRESLLAGLKYVYGDSTWVDFDRVIADYWDPNTDPQDARRFFLNQITHASDSYITAPEWKGCEKPEAVERGVAITLGFDGSRGSGAGKPDASALIGMTLGGHLIEFGVWEAPDGPEQNTWEAPVVGIDAAVHDAFARFDVVAFFADPAKDWRSKVGEWEARYGSRLKVKVSENHPCEWWFSGGRTGIIEKAVLGFAAAVRNKELTHDGSYALTTHVLNTRRRVRSKKLTVGKANDYSPNKIDACVAAILANDARRECIAQGVLAKQASVYDTRGVREVDC